MPLLQLNEVVKARSLQAKSSAPQLERGKRVYLKHHRHRWLYQGCSRSFNDEAELLRPYSRITRQAEVEVLWQLKDRNQPGEERAGSRLW